VHARLSLRDDPSAPGGQAGCIGSSGSFLLWSLLFVDLLTSHRIAAVVKVPQLLALLRSRSTVGVSLSMYSLELFSQSVAVFYHRVHGFPVSTYGENLTLGAGNVAILACFAAINRDPRAIVSLLFPLLLAPLQRYPSLLSLLQSLSIPINIAAKLPQLVINQQLISLLRARLALLHEQQRLLQQPALAAALVAQTPLQWPPVPKSSLAALPFALNLAGSTSRLFTTVTQLDGDAVMLAGFAISCALNAAILLQCRYIHSLQQQCTSMAGHVASLTTKLLQAHPPSCEQ